MMWVHAWRMSASSCQRLCAIKFSSQKLIFEPGTSGIPLGQDDWSFELPNMQKIIFRRKMALFLFECRVRGSEQMMT